MSVAGRGLGSRWCALLLLLTAAGCAGRPLPENTATGGSAGTPSASRGGTGGGAGAAGGVAGTTAGGGGGGGVVDCTSAPSGTICRPGTCADGVVDGRYACNAQGTCAPAPAFPCAPYRCDARTNRCASVCAIDADCTNGRLCLNGSCAVQTASCSANGECASGFCVDGLCCNVSCGGACVSCTLPGREGTCTPVGAGSVDPRGLCGDAGAATCGRNGTCDGVGGCANYPTGTTCGVADCRDGIFTTAARCNGIGTCVRTTIPCAPFTCEPQKAACRSTCTADPHCAVGTICVNGSCGVKAPN